MATSASLSAIPACTNEHSIEDMLKINPDPLFTKFQAAVYLNVKVSYVEDLVKHRELTKSLGRPIRIRMSECERFIRDRTVPATRFGNASRFN